MLKSIRVEFLGITFDIISIKTLVDYILNFSGSYITIVTPNVDHTIRFNSDDNFRAIYKQSDITVNDSRILKILSKIANVDLGEVIPGSDLTKAIVENLRCVNHPITVIGCSDETIRIVREQYKINIVNHYNPPMGFIDDVIEVDKCVNYVLSNPSKIVFICVGSPRQEVLSLKLKNAGATGVALCVGASFLFLSGEEKRAPKYIQNLSLEWLFRLLQSPRRLFRRYVLDGIKIFPIFLKYLMNRD